MRNGTRYIKRVNGQYESSQILCPDCGRRIGCSLQASKLTEWQRARRKTCHVFQIKIGFRPPTVGVGGIFNTFRIGKAWSGRLIEGDVVALEDTVSEAVFGLARVVKVLLGPKADMEATHASANHNLVGERLTPNEAAQWLKKRLLKRYGPRIYNDATEHSVIYLECINEERK